MAKTFGDWYKQNKDRLSEERKLKYRTDPTYRATVQARSQDYRARTRALKPPVEGGMQIAEVAGLLEISSWTLNKWRTLGYYPTPKKEKGHPIFTYGQCELLSLIRDFFREYPRKAAASKKDQLAQVVEVVHHNWESS